MSINDRYIDLCYTILSKHLHFPDVADTWKDIQDGINYMGCFSLNNYAFLQTKGDIIDYIKKVRCGNIIDLVKGQSPFLYIPSPSGKTLNDCTPQELYNNLISELQRLILKGIHQTIKHFYYIESEEALATELVRQDIAVLQKYNLVNTEDNKNG